MKRIIPSSILLNHNMAEFDNASEILTGGELRNSVNGFLTSYATDSVRFSQQILDI